MLSLRAFTRAAPRTFSRSLSTAARPAARPLSAAIQRPSLLASTQKSIAKQAYPAFSTARILREPAGEGDVELIAKFEEELRHEKASGLDGLEASVENVKLLLENGPWEVKDVPGEQEVVFSRKFGNEDIRVTFTVADLQNVTEQPEFDDALSDEADYADHSHSVNQSRSGQGNVGVHPEDRVSPADREYDELGEPSFPARVNVTIEKPGAGALLIQTVAQDGVFEVEEVSYFAKPDLAHAQTAEKDWTRQSLYAGPPFENLDEDLQNYFERYLEERGINSELANVIPDYIQVKEQKEYVRWLENVKNFVAA
ncbi:hypothetical protein VTN96DRAFT_6418 [Rasamsonia emersonii]|uniref:Regulatory protein SUAPRGA1 n=1 Tax=Rasamsonia emersonii (strain ATCC 16479 / CBS 393.64 / IMI 116815) TaxID=1408163 RepID=A0A0F4YNH0_RASE3|nr:Regulatory protein SUAPRGA1 [Rasamsonia emersonii CBS 393.64]KKA19178.1 Regulatory protein SUAPRGA1 [Rasamsonia emersonii CBS 393.64]